MLLPSAERGQARCLDARHLLRFEERFDEPDVEDVAHSLVAAGKRFAAGVELLCDLVRNVEARHQAGRVDCERGELDAVGCDQVVVLGGAVVDFIDVQWWPIFNVADMGVVVGAVLLVLTTWRHGDGTDADVDEGASSAAPPAA